MILLSNVIKPFSYISLDDKKLIESVFSLHVHPPHLQAQGETAAALSVEDKAELEEAGRVKEQIIKDAEEFANEQIQAAMQECATIREQAQAEISEWWQERRSQDDEVVQQANDSGFQEGYQQGIAQAEAAIKEQYAEMLQESRAILEQSYLLKQQIIQESEPFLIELSTSIAEKIVGHQLTVSPEWVIEMTQKVLARRREKGSITLCVSPKHFAYIQDAREELLTSIDSLAELEIIPDSSVHDYGCVVRSPFGSIDARIDTQLNEIKSALQQIAYRNDGDDA
jgi:flagellar assembly protein FliH